MTEDKFTHKSVMKILMYFKLKGFNNVCLNLQKLLSAYICKNKLLLKTIIQINKKNFVMKYLKIVAYWAENLTHNEIVCVI